MAWQKTTYFVLHFLGQNLAHTQMGPLGPYNSGMEWSIIFFTNDPEMLQKKAYFSFFYRNMRREHLLFHHVLVKEGGYHSHRHDLAGLVDDLSNFFILDAHHVLSIHL